MELDIIEYLERVLEEDLPGAEAQLRMAPIKDLPATPSGANKIGCVLLLLYPKGKKWHLVLVQRSLNPNDAHSGQISFPGGRFEESDYSYSDCALRETQEEIGVDPSEIGIVGELSSIYVHASDYLVYPFVGFTTTEPDFEVESNEVTKIIDFPIALLGENKIKKSKSFTSNFGYDMDNVPYYDILGHEVWGATAMILSEFEHIIDGFEE